MYHVATERNGAHASPTSRASAAVSATLGVASQTLHNWVKAEARGLLKGTAARPVSPEQMEISRLRAELGRVFADLQIWRDLNGDGDVGFGELRSIADYEVKSISLTYTPFTQPATNPGTILTEIGSYRLNDGTVRAVGDALLERQTLTGGMFTPVDETPTSQGLPNFRGYRAMRNLRAAMSQHSGLEGAIGGLLAGTPQQVLDGLDPILYR